jgi:hypothetical protein
MKSEHFLKEGFVEDASDVHADHEVQMARADLFHAAEDALTLHKLLRNVSEQQGLEGWVAAKITLASDYLKTVREYIEYELMTAASEQPMLPIAEGSVPKEKQKTPYRDINSPEYRKAAEKQKEKMDKEKAAEPGKKLLGKIEKKDMAEDLGNVDQAQAIADKLTSDKNLTKLSAMAHDSTIYRTLDRYFEKHGIPETIYNRVAAIVFKKLRDNGRRLSTEPALQEQGMAEEQVTETSAGSVAGVVNPPTKNKAKVGTLFGGTYKQKKSK